MLNIDAVIQQLRAERDRAQTQLHRLDRAITALVGVGKPTIAETERRGRTLSPAARRRIAEAQTRRWAKTRAKTKAKAVRKRRSLSPAARARIAAAAKARWAKYRAQKNARHD